MSQRNIWPLWGNYLILTPQVVIHLVFFAQNGSTSWPKWLKTSIWINPVDLLSHLLPLNGSQLGMDHNKSGSQLEKAGHNVWPRVIMSSFIWSDTLVAHLPWHTLVLQGVPKKCSWRTVKVGDFQQFCFDCHGWTKCVTENPQPSIESWKCQLFPDCHWFSLANLGFPSDNKE